MFGFLSQERPAYLYQSAEPLVRLAGNLLDPIGRLLSWQPPLSRERVHYV
ncbi:MAG: hypothetical protein EDM05_000405 (plasmid) [Leptolyngbya sp. IPPAS B-1204]